MRATASIHVLELFVLAVAVGYPSFECLAQPGRRFESRDEYPSARSCATCHPQHYAQWRVSGHAYAQMDPIHVSLDRVMTEALEVPTSSHGPYSLASRSPVAAAIGEPDDMPVIAQSPESREGISCIACHRVDVDVYEAERRISLEPGDLTKPVCGTSDGQELNRVLGLPDEYRGLTIDDSLGRKIHSRIIAFPQLATSAFCMVCHEGPSLIEAPAAQRGVTCQDCHMSTQPGRPAGFEIGPAAVVGGVPTRDRKLTDHAFAGLNGSILHPGVFPHDSRAVKEELRRGDPAAEGMATLREWLTFDLDSGWGTDEFEDQVPASYRFPPRWSALDDRYDARRLVEDHLEALEWHDQRRLQLLRNGLLLGDIVPVESKSGIRFKVSVESTTDGHRVPTRGTRLFWLEVTVVDREGNLNFHSGDHDPNSDLRDRRSSFVHAGELPLDGQLFTIENRVAEASTLPVPFPVAPPGALPAPVPPPIPDTDSNAERRIVDGLEPLEQRWVTYELAREALTGKPPYRCRISLKAAPYPVNLVVTLQRVGFDWFLTPRAVADGIRKRQVTIWSKTFDWPEDDGHR